MSAKGEVQESAGAILFFAFASTIPLLLRNLKDKPTRFPRSAAPTHSFSPTQSWYQYRIQSEVSPRRMTATELLRLAERSALHVMTWVAADRNHGS